mmetsp:Transcript_5518/g.12676  ORF Transcript_5518/g.12676 Transcript_5518/m.12676 type:complete len:282 (-) Transcript_5518:1636-2481(-)
MDPDRLHENEILPAFLSNSPTDFPQLEHESSEDATDFFRKTKKTRRGKRGGRKHKKKSKSTGELEEAKQESSPHAFLGQQEHGAEWDLEQTDSSVEKLEEPAIKTERRTVHVPPLPLLPATQIRIWSDNGKMIVRSQSGALISPHEQDIPKPARTLTSIEKNAPRLASDGGTPPSSPPPRANKYFGPVVKTPEREDRSISQVRRSIIVTDKNNERVDTGDWHLSASLCEEVLSPTVFNQEHVPSFQVSSEEIRFFKGLLALGGEYEQPSLFALLAIWLMIL